MSCKSISVGHSSLHSAETEDDGYCSPDCHQQREEGAGALVRGVRVGGSGTAQYSLGGLTCNTKIVGRVARSYIYCSYGRNLKKIIIFFRDIIIILIIIIIIILGIYGFGKGL